MVNAAGCVCLSSSVACVEDSTFMLYAVLYFSYSILLCAVVMVVRWRRCLVTGATRPQGSVVREEEGRRALLAVVEEARECKWYLSNVCQVVRNRPILPICVV